MAPADQMTNAATGPIRQRCARVLEKARALNLLERKTETVSARINPDLLHIARKNTGVETNSALVEMAIVNLAIADGFPGAFERARGRVLADLDLDI